MGKGGGCVEAWVVEGVGCEPGGLECDGKRAAGEQVALEPFEYIDSIKDEAEKKAAQVRPPSLHLLTCTVSTPPLPRAHSNLSLSLTPLTHSLSLHFGSVLSLTPIAAGDQGGLPAQHRGLPREARGLEPGGRRPARAISFVVSLFDSSADTGRVACRGP